MRTGWRGIAVLLCLFGLESGCDTRPNAATSDAGMDAASVGDGGVKPGSATDDAAPIDHDARVDAAPADAQPDGMQPDAAETAVDVCAVANGGCDPLVVCTPDAVAHRCGECPAGYRGELGAACVPTLLSLSTSAGMLEPAFSPSVDSYRVNVSLWTDTITLTATGPADASIAIGDQTLTPGAAWQSPVLVPGDSSFTIAVSSPDHPTRHVAVVIARASAQQLRAVNPAPDQSFGSRVALSDDTLLVAAPLAPVGGTVDVFTLQSASWVWQASLQAEQPSPGDRFGQSLAISGDTIVVGAPFEASAADTVGGDQHDETAANSGAAYVFRRSQDVWTQEAYLKPSHSGAGDQFGNSVAISGDTIIVGAPFEDGSASGVNGTNDEAAPNSGAAYVFKHDQAGWMQTAYVKPAVTGSGDGFGAGVAISDETFVVAAPQEDSASVGIDGDPHDDSAVDSGAVYVFTIVAGSVIQEAYLKASNPGGMDADYQYSTGDGFGGGESLAGRGVAIRGDTIVVGAAGEDSAALGIDGNQNDETRQDSGAAYVFVRNTGVWTQQAYLKPFHPNTAGSNFGNSIALGDERLVVGAWQAALDVPGADGTTSGAVYTFLRDHGTWKPEHYLNANSVDTRGRFGWSVAVGGQATAVGAPGSSGGACVF
jgi:hypothetical protein